MTGVSFLFLFCRKHSFSFAVMAVLVYRAGPARSLYAFEREEERMRGGDTYIYHKESRAGMTGNDRNVRNLTRRVLSLNACVPAPHQVLVIIGY